MKPHEAAFLPGPPPVLWSPYLAQDRPGLAVWNRSHRVWYLLTEERPLGEGAPRHAVWLTPEPPLSNTAGLMARIEAIERFIRGD